MAGYNYDSWKSNNAVYAEERGLYKATELAKLLKIDSSFILEHAPYEEKHHTSLMYNLTKYYDLNAVRSFLKKNKNLYNSFLAEQKEAVFENRKFAKVSWTEFSKSGGRWVPEKVEYENVLVSSNGKFYTFHRLGLRKKIKSNAEVKLFTAEDLRLLEKKKNQEEKEKKRREREFEKLKLQQPKKDKLLEKIFAKALKIPVPSYVGEVKFWFAKKGNKIKELTLMDGRPWEKSFSDFREDERKRLGKIGKVYSAKIDDFSRLKVKIDGVEKEIKSFEAFKRL